MLRHPYHRIVLGLVLALAVVGTMGGTAQQRAAGDQVPTFELDTSWPKPLPNNWALGEAWGIAVDARDHPWVLHSTNHKSPAMRELVAKEGKRLAPPVVEFDAPKPSTPADRFQPA